MFYKSCYCSPGQDHMQRLWCGLHSQRRTRCWENYLWWWNSEWIQGNQNIWIVPMFLDVFSTLNCNIYHVRRCLHIDCPHFCNWPNSGNHLKRLKVVQIFPCLQNLNPLSQKELHPSGFYWLNCFNLWLLYDPLLAGLP